jgi:hypothetical protein
MKQTSMMIMGLMFLGLQANADTVAEARMSSYIKYNDASVVAPVSILNMMIHLNVNGEIDPLSPNIDNEIPSHGHYNYTLSGTVEDSTGKCKFTSLWFQQNGPLMTTKQLLDSGVDSKPQWNSIKLCSGLVMKFESVRKLMITGSTQDVSVYAPGIATPIAKGSILMKEAPVSPPVKKDPLVDPCQD